MNISVVSAVGHGRTELAAFDHALVQVGVGDFNLIPLSSVIPADCAVEPRAELPGSFPRRHGDRLYVVMAQERSRVPGAWVGAAVGWTRIADGRGWFVEHHLSGDDGDALRRDLDELVRDSLSDLCEHRGVRSGRTQIVGEVVQVAAQATCALALATYRCEGWDG